MFLISAYLWAQSVWAVIAPPPAVEIPGIPEQPKIALIQYNADRTFGDEATHRAALTRFALDAVNHGAKIIVFPEGSEYGYASRERAWCTPGRKTCGDRRCQDVSGVAEQVPDGQTSLHWEAFARVNGVYVVYSLPEKDRGQFFNTLGVAGPRGFVTKYRKRVLYRLDRCFAHEGKSPAVLDTPYGKFGLMICMDAAEEGRALYHEYRKMGVDGVIVSMDWDEDQPASRRAHAYFSTLVRSVGLDIYAADGSEWDGTGKYDALKGSRERRGMLAHARGQDGVSYHVFKD